PQLIDTASGCVASAATTSANSEANVVSFASNNSIVACGAIACAHSTSSDVSSPQFPFEPAAADCFLTSRVKQPFFEPPAPQTPGRPYCWLNVSASETICGSS